MNDNGNVVYLGIGSNVDAENNIVSGIQTLRQELGELTLSPVYSTRAVGFEGANFLNLVARAVTDLGPLELKHRLNELESKHGRLRDVPKFSDRTLDIDILLHGTLWLRVPDLELPRPEILHFAHVLRPLADIAPDLIHPALRQPVKALWKEFEDKPEMEQLKIPALEV